MVFRALARLKFISDYFSYADVQFAAWSYDSKPECIHMGVS